MHNTETVDLLEEQKRLLTKIEEDRKERLKKGEIILNTGFDQYSMESVLHDLDKVADDANIKEIKLYINSRGGRISALFPLVDWIERSKKPVSTIVLGYAYSCGAMLLLSGTKGYRKSSKRSDILIHEASTAMAHQSCTQHKHSVEYLDRVNKMLIDLIKKKTTMPTDLIKHYMESNLDIFITPEDCLKYGLIDEII